ncbi:hypothetical protein I4U23_004686 [Adineta vaga]|nr:hypothetical protein I4U23_004686 [Adineta vaga]
MTNNQTNTSDLQSSDNDSSQTTIYAQVRRRKRTWLIVAMVAVILIIIAFTTTLTIILLKRQKSTATTMWANGSSTIEIITATAELTTVARKDTSVTAELTTVARKDTSVTAELTTVARKDTSVTAELTTVARKDTSATLWQTTITKLSPTTAIKITENKDLIYVPLGLAHMFKVLIQLFYLKDGLVVEHKVDKLIRKNVRRLCTNLDIQEPLSLTEIYAKKTAQERMLTNGT